MNITQTSPGLVVNILGPDGSGKSTLAKSLAAKLREDGATTTLCRWSDIVNGRLSTDESLCTLLRELYVEAWRALYIGATDDRSRRLLQAPPDFAGFRAAGLESEAPNQPVGATTSGMTASALLEFVADVLIAAQVVRPLVQAGHVVVADSSGIKNVGKVLSVAGALGNDMPSQFVGLLRTAVLDAYRSSFLTPEIGIVLNVDPEVCRRRRLSQRGRVGPVEDLAFAGRTDDSFVELQRDMLDQYLRVAAESTSWHVIDATDLTPEELVDHAAALVQGVLTGRCEQPSAVGTATRGAQ
ncbi:MAG TPA: hypothetical protein VFW65_03420 [Pseudonocardiaceae bacterium]|nr:hypothetical protein [Pseudonocardiaceae bacterium]